MSRSSDPPQSCVHCGLPVPLSRQTSNPHTPKFCCFGCRMASNLFKQGQLDTDNHQNLASTSVLRIGLGVFLAMNIMAFSFFFYSQDLYHHQVTQAGADDGFAMLSSLFAYLQMLLCTLVLVLLGMPLLDDILQRLATSHRLPLDANLLILLGTTSAYVLSVIHTFQGNNHLYFDTAAMVLVFVTLGGFLDSVAKQRAIRTLDQLDDRLPTQVLVASEKQFHAIPWEQVRVGDKIQIPVGSIIPVDGQIVEGASQIVESQLTGEPHPREVGFGDHVFAGTENLGGLLYINATRVGQDCSFRQLQQLLAEARLTQPPFQKYADRLASVFVPSVMALSLAVLAWYWTTATFDIALFHALSVLLISCPCALGLAAPLTTWCAMTGAAKQGILFRHGEAIERAAKVRHLFFDKTGTLTNTQMQLVKIETLPTMTKDIALSLAAAMESASTHPIAKTIIDAAKEKAVTLAHLTDIKMVDGTYLEAKKDATVFHLGSSQLLKTKDPFELGATGGHFTYLLKDNRPIARFTLVESLRPNAANTISQLVEMGLTVSVLTGDTQVNLNEYERLLNVKLHTGLTPKQKLDHLQEAQKKEGQIAMVGDGINDAPALAAADLGIAMGNATDLAKQAGNVKLLGDHLADVPKAILIAKRTMKLIRWNLFWAFGYNSIGLVLAAMGYLKPTFAALAMVLSSLLVIGTSIRAGYDLQDDDRY